MVLFLGVYIGITLVFDIAVFLLSYHEPEYPKCRTVLLAFYIWALIMVFFATGYGEVHFAMTRLQSTLVALIALVSVYVADTLGSKVQNHKEK